MAVSRLSDQQGGIDLELQHDGTWATTVTSFALQRDLVDAKAVLGCDLDGTNRRILASMVCSDRHGADLRILNAPLVFLRAVV